MSLEREHRWVQAPPMRAPRHPASSLAAVARRSPADRVIVFGVSFAVAALVALIVTQCLDFAVYDLRIRALDSDTHRSVFGVISLLAQAGTVLVIGARCLSPSRRAGWLVLGALIAVLLLVRALLSDQPLAYALPVTAAFVLFWWLTAADYPAARTVLRVGLFVLAFSFVVHIVGPKIIDHLGYGYGTWPYEIKGMTKHSAELAGWVLVDTGVLAGWVASRRPA
ncbi:MAG TPA: hypothetical protein VFW09_14795 [Solirubrobacteraceae bacterium]|nr:hypothetical protein [Solirubrobacteraceae bacterium]